MQKTKLGMSVGVFGALLYFSGLFSGYLLTTLLAGYVLFKEENLWLKKAAIKSVALLVFFSALSSVVGLIPQVFDIVNYAAHIFGGYFSIGFVNNIVSLLLAVITFAKTIIFILLGLKSFSQGTVGFPMIDSFISKHIN